MKFSNKVVLACAGSGKTWGICKDALKCKSGKKKILISYTNKSVESLKLEYKKQNRGIIDDDIIICTWYQFVLRELIKPYQTVLFKEGKGINHVNSINFKDQYKRLYYKKGEYKYFFDSGKNIRVNRVSECALLINNRSRNKAIKRLESNYSHIYIDELQDLVGRDIELIELLFSSSINTHIVGDYKQSTLKTHNANANKRKGGMFIFDYLESIKSKYDLEIINENSSKRFTEDIADIANFIYQENPIEGKNKDSVSHMGVYLIKKEFIDIYIQAYNPTILRYDKNTNTQGYPAINFGISKGMTIDRVLIFPNGPLKKFLKNPEVIMKSREKYYVGITRAKYTLTFVVDKYDESTYFKPEEIEIDGEVIPCQKYKK